MSKKRRFSEVTKLSSPSSQFNWNLCIFCQVSTKEKLFCPAGIKRENHEPLETYEKVLSNISRFRELDCLPCSLSLPEDLSYASVLLDNGAKFHKQCSNKFNDLKLDRAEKRVKSMSKDNTTSKGDFNTEVLNKDCPT